MKIGINGRFLAAKRTGVQRAAYNLIRAIVKADRVNDYVLFTPQGEVDNPDWAYPNVKIVPSNLREGETIRNHIWEQFTLPRLAKRHGVDLLHSPANLAPLFYSGKSIVHIHDLCFVVNPQWYSYSFRTLYNFIIPRLVRRAAKVITISNNSRNDLLQFCDLPAERVSHIYWAVDDPHRPKSHDRGIDVGASPRPADSLLMIQGPLLLDWNRRKFGVLPRVENACLQRSQPPDARRIDLWLKARISPAANPNWYFAKLHTHGVNEPNQSVLLSDPMVRFHNALKERMERNVHFHAHYVTARQMANLALAPPTGGGPTDALKDSMYPKPVG